METVLKIEILDAIKADAVLYGKVAAAAGVSPFTMPRLIRDNDPKLALPGPREVLRKHLGVKDSELLQQPQSVQ